MALGSGMRSGILGVFTSVIRGQDIQFALAYGGMDVSRHAGNMVRFYMSYGNRLADFAGQNALSLPCNTNID